MIFIQVILPVFLIIFTGFFFEKIKKPDFKSISDLTLYFFTPCLIFKGLVLSKINLSQFLPKAIIFMLLLTTILWIVSYILSKFFKFDDYTQSAFILGVVMMNTGNFGLPLILFAFGEEGLAYAVIVLVLFTFPLGTLAIFIASKGRSSLKNAFLEIFKIPLFYSIFFAALVKYLGLTIPSLIMKPIVLIGDAAIPSLLILLGMQLARTNIKTNFFPVVTGNFLRLIISPLLSFLICYFIGIKGLAAKVLIIQTSTPSAIIPLLYAINYNTRPDIVASSIFFSTIFSSLTLTILLYLI